MLSANCRVRSPIICYGALGTIHGRTRDAIAPSCQVDLAFAHVLQGIATVTACVSIHSSRLTSFTISTTIEAGGVEVRISAAVTTELNRKYPVTQPGGLQEISRWSAERNHRLSGRDAAASWRDARML